MAGNLTFRLFQPDDIAGVLQLWEESSGWGGITEKQFYDWYIETPYGESLLVVAVDEANRVVGQEGFTPTRVYVDGGEKKALRLSAPILAKEFREKISDSAHPTVEMYRVGMNAAIKNNYSVVYSFPVIAWLPFLRRLCPLPGLKPDQFTTAKFDCYGLMLKSLSAENSADEAVEVMLATEFNEEYEELWLSAKNELPINCGINRCSIWLKWKLGSHCVLEVRRKDDKELMGYAAIKKDSGLLVDALARSPKDLETTLIVAIEALSQREDLKNQANVEEIKVMKTEALASVIQKLQFKREKFKFAFWCYSIDESVPIQLLEPSRWYLMPND